MNASNMVGQKTISAVRFQKDVEREPLSYFKLLSFLNPEQA